MENLATWLPITISILALGGSLYFSKNSQRSAESAAETARLNFVSEKERELREFVGEVGNVYVTLRTGGDEDRKVALVRLSVLTDFGRIFFPNDRSPLATNFDPRGHRSLILDPLVETTRRCKAGEFDQDACKRDFLEFVERIGERTTPFATRTSPEAAGKTQYRNS